MSIAIVAGCPIPRSPIAMSGQFPPNSRVNPLDPPKFP